jgi:hypothetical protein
LTRFQIICQLKSINQILWIGLFVTCAFDSWRLMKIWWKMPKNLGKSLTGVLHFRLFYILIWMCECTFYLLLLNLRLCRYFVASEARRFSSLLHPGTGGFLILGIVPKAKNRLEQQL